MNPSEPIDVQGSPPDLGRIAQGARALALEWALSLGLRPSETPNFLTVELILLAAESGDVVLRTMVELPESPDDWGAALADEVSRVAVAMEASNEPDADPADPDAPPPTRLLVLSTPPGAQVDLDGESANGTTPWILEVGPGPHRLGLSLTGYRSEEIEVSAWPGQTRPIEVRLERGSRRLWYRTWWFWTIVGVVVAGGVAGFVSWGVISSRDQPDVSVQVNGLSSDPH